MKYLFWEIRDTGLTRYVCPCKGDLTDQNIPSEKLEALDSPSMLVHAKVIWLIRTSFLRNQRHWTHLLCWSMQRRFDWSEHPFWEIIGTGLTPYVGPCKGDLTDQNIPSEKSHWTHRLCWSMQRWFDWSEHPFWEIRGTGLTPYVGPCKGDLTDQNISSEKSEALDSRPMLVHSKVIWLIRTSLLKIQRHTEHLLAKHAENEVCLQILYKWYSTYLLQKSSKHLFIIYNKSSLTY